MVVTLALVAIPLRHRGFAVVTVADALDLPLPRPFAPEVQRGQTSLAGGEVDLYQPTRDARSPAGRADRSIMVLVPGAAPEGRDDQRVQALAEAFARSGQLVVVPELVVYRQDLVVEDIQRLVDLVDVLTTEHGPVVLAGISFGGSLSLIAAGDPRLRDQVALVATFGAYADLVGVVQAVTTGESLVDGERFGWQPDPRAEEVVRDQVLGLLPDADREALRAVFEGMGEVTELSSPLQGAYELLTTEDPVRVLELVDRLPRPIYERLAQVSPLRAVPDLQVPIVAMHARDDPVIPYGELHRLGSGYPHAELVTVRTFDHVGIDPGEATSWWVTVQDLWSTTGFVERILRATW